jgi:hypothetical protein
VALSAYGKVETVSAIIGTGFRQGVDMSWGRAATLAHFGIDLTGQSAGSCGSMTLSSRISPKSFLRRHDGLGRCAGFRRDAVTE